MIRLLLVSANPSGTEKIRTDKEFNLISSRFSSSEHRDDIVVRSCLAVSVNELRNTMFEYRPNIVHFSGHGTIESLIFESDASDFISVNSERVLDFLSLFSRVEGVFLNACYSSGANINGVFKSIPFVVAVKGRVRDNDAIVFSSSFYGAIFNGEDVDKAFSIAESAVSLDAREYSFTRVDRSIASSFELRKSQFTLYRSSSYKENLESKKYLYVFGAILCAPVIFFVAFLIYSNWS